MLYLLEFVMSIVWPFFRHDTIGSGDPFGGPHSSITVSLCATRVFCGSSRNSSRSTGTKKSVMGLVQVPKLLIKLWITMEIIIKRNYVYKSRISLSCSVIQFANKKPPANNLANIVRALESTSSARFFMWEEISYYFSLCLVNIDYHERFFSGLAALPVAGRRQSERGEEK